MIFVGKSAFFRPSGKNSNTFALSVTETAFLCPLGARGVLQHLRIFIVLTCSCSSYFWITQLLLKGNSPI